MSATREGVGTQQNPRAEMLAEISKARQDQLAQEFKEGGGDISVLEPGDNSKTLQMPEGTDPAEWEKLDETSKAGLVEAEEQRKAAEAAAGDGEQKVVAETSTEAAAPPKKVKIKVDGQELEVDEEAVRDAGIKALQKQSAADKRLEESARLKKEAEAEARRILDDAKKQASQTNQDTQQLPDKGAAGVERLTDDNFINAVKAIQYGSESEAGQALKTLIAEAAKSGKPAELTLNEVGEYLEFREATKWAHDEYKDILGDPRLKMLFSAEEKRIRAAGDSRPYREVYEDIGKGLREWVKEKAPSPAKDLTRHERKASVVTIPTASARQPAPSQPKELSPSEIVDRIRKARHQA